MTQYGFCPLSEDALFSDLYNAALLDPYSDLDLISPNVTTLLPSIDKNDITLPIPVDSRSSQLPVDSKTSDLISVNVTTLLSSTDSKTSELSSPDNKTSELLPVDTTLPLLSRPRETRLQKRQRRELSTFIPDIKPASGDDCISTIDDSNFVVDDTTIIYEDDTDDSHKTDSDSDDQYIPIKRKHRNVAIKHKISPILQLTACTKYVQYLKVNASADINCKLSHTIRVIRIHGSIQKSYCHCGDLLTPLLSGNKCNAYRESIKYQVLKIHVPSVRNRIHGQIAYVFTVEGLRSFMKNNKLNQSRYANYKKWIIDNILTPLEAYETADLQAEPSILNNVIATAASIITYQ